MKREDSLVIHRSITPAKISRDLLCKVYVPVTLVVFTDEQRTLLCLELFDSRFCRRKLRFPSACAGVWVLVGCPGGIAVLQEYDRENLRRIEKQLDGRRMRVFVAGEEVPCRELSGWQHESIVRINEQETPF